MSEDHIGEFVHSLACAATPENVFNQYAQKEPANAVRRSNLRRYLRAISQRQPRMVLVGEAAGYRGCRLTGVPFTSERIMLDSVTGRNFLGDERGFVKTGERPRTVGEQSATIVWGTLQELRPLPLLWNALPFHPHRPLEPWSNRTPTRAELELGQPFLRHFLKLFPLELIVAVGNKADEALGQQQIPHRKVRHPAHGGKAEFVRGIRSLASSERRWPPTLPP